MKSFYAIAFALSFFSLNAQVADKTVTDCSGTSNSIYAVLGSGKVLVVASKGVDCSTCKGSAPQVQTFASQNKGTIEVWGALTYAFNSNNPTCTQVNNWVSTYNWTDIFTFADTDRHFYKTGTPRYIVYDPSDSTVAYSGPNRTQAFQVAQSLASSVGSVEENLSELSIINFRGGIEVINLTDRTTYELFDITGKNVDSGVLMPSEGKIYTENFNQGIYLIRFETTSGITVRKIYMN